MSLFGWRMSIPRDEESGFRCKWDSYKILGVDRFFTSDPEEIALRYKELNVFSNLIRKKIALSPELLRILYKSSSGRAVTNTYRLFQRPASRTRNLGFRKTNRIRSRIGARKNLICQPNEIRPEHCSYCSRHFRSWNAN